jgi:hypothetical protein
MNNNLQELVMVKLELGDPALTFVETNDYTIKYHSFLTLGNTNDTIVVTLNGVPDITLSMMGLIECPVDGLEITAVNQSSSEPTVVTKGLLVFGVKRYKTLF